MSKPAWWPTAADKKHADAGCAHPDRCNVEDREFYDSLPDLTPQDLGYEDPKEA